MAKKSKIKTTATFKEEQPSPANPYARQCHAKRKCDGKRCTKMACSGKAVCDRHGGKNKDAAEAGRFKHGRYSRSMPKNLFAKWNEARNDPELLNLADDAALLSTRTAELLENLEHKTPPWLAAEQAMIEIDKATTLSDKHDRLKELRQIILDGAAATVQYLDSWKELREIACERSRITTAETKRLKTLSEFMSGKDARALVASVLNAVKENVKDPAVLLKINDSIRRTLSIKMTDPIMNCEIVVPPGEAKPTPVVIDQEPEVGSVIPFEQGQ